MAIKTLMRVFFYVQCLRQNKIIRFNGTESLNKCLYNRGLFASVRKCQSLETGESYAAKFTSRQRYGEDCSTEIYHEIALLSLCGGAPRVIQIHDVFENVNEIIIVMEYAPGGDLQTIIDENLVPFESDVVSFIRQTAEGLDYLHKRRIAHLDIKPQNIVMMAEYPNCEIKLCDFEISRVILEGKDIRELLGTPDYVAPEILHYDPITLAADMWSLGVTTYVMLTGYSPFGGETDQETFCNISRGEVDFPDDLFKDVSSEAIDFVKSLLVKNPKARLTASASLKHPWLKKDKKETTKNTENVENVENIENVENVNPVQMKNNNELGSKEDSPVIYTNKPNIENKEELAEISQQQDNNKTLRKYLSKSREALFDKVVQKHNNTNLKKHTFKNHRFRKTRMCESQISLFSKSQEKLLGGEILNAPSRSIEKLYGLRSLSKSQEVLNLYKMGGLLASQENLNLVSELIKSRENLLGAQDGDPTKYRKLMRATTADLGVLHQKTQPTRMDSYSSTTSLASFATNVPEYEDEEEEEEKYEDVPNDSKAFYETNYTSDKKILNQNDSASREKQNNIEETKPTIMKEIEKLERQKESLKDIQEGDDEEEPRFTVAQLITAFNKHQEIVTKTSLEVTMTAHEKKIKMPSIAPYNQSSFPTGPKALRLFIPDIDLVEVPKKFTSKYKMRFPEDKIMSKEKSHSPKDSDDFDILRMIPSSLNSSQSTINSSTSSRNYSSQEEQIYSSKTQKELNKKPVQQKYNQEKEKVSLTVPPQRRNKSSNPVVEISKVDMSYRGSDNHRTDDVIIKRSPTPNRRVGVNRSVERSPSVTRKSFAVERSPSVGRNSVTVERSPSSGRNSVAVERSPSFGRNSITAERSSSATRNSLTVDRSPVPQRKTSTRSFQKSEDSYSSKKQSDNFTSSSYKIVGIGDRNANYNRASSGVSYKIEFNSPIVKRKFPTRNMLNKGTISSNLKVRETVRARK